jgi:hypothetical protein
MFPKQNTKLGFVVMLYSVIPLFLPSSISETSASLSSPSHYVPFGYDYQQATELRRTPESNTTTEDTITFLTPEIRINYPSSWDALPGIPTSPYVDSIVTFTLLPENNNNNNDTSVDGTGILNIAKHALFHESVELEEYVGTQVYFLRNIIPGFNLLQLNVTTLDGKPAYQAVYTGLEGTDTTQTMKLWVRSGSIRYIVTYSANAESFPSHLESVRNILGSLRIAGAQADIDIGRITEVLDRIPESSRERVVDFVNSLVLDSVFDENLRQFIEGSNTTLPSNFTKLPAYPADADEDRGISAHYYLSPAYLSPPIDNPEINEPYKLLVLIFTNSTSNRLISEPPPIDYKLRINGTGISIEEIGNTPTGLDVKILNGISFVEALKNPQQYSIGLEIQ